MLETIPKHIFISALPIKKGIFYPLQRQGLYDSTTLVRQFRYLLLKFQYFAL
jgi:hypothetical protein